jgi:hypothetical protein
MNFNLNKHQTFLKLWKFFLRENKEESIEDLTTLDMTMIPTRDMHDKTKDAKHSVDRDAMFVPKKEWKDCGQIFVDNAKIVSNFISYDAIDELVKTDNPLKDNKIAQILGKGKFGIAYLLSNDHVLKFGRTNNLDDLELYKKFSKRPSRNFICFDWYRFSSEPKLFYAEMNRFMTFRDFSTFIGKMSADEFKPLPKFLEAILKKFVEQFQNYEEKNGKPVKLSELAKSSSSWKKQISQFVKDFSSQYKVTDTHSFSILSSMLHIISKSKRSHDLHLDNLGVNISGGVDNPQFFFFDR